MEKERLINELPHIYELEDMMAFVEIIQEFIFMAEAYSRNTFGGVILALSDKYYHQIIPKFREYRYQNYFVMTELIKERLHTRLDHEKRGTDI